LKSNTDHKLVTGAVFLAASGMIVKVLGLVCKIPLVHIIGDRGMGYYNCAYTIYNLLYILCGTGIPVAVSILVSEGAAKGDRKGVFLIFRTVFFAILPVGLLGAGFLLFSSHSLARWIGNPPAYIAISVMAPVFLFSCLSGALRGYFQGRMDMMPTGISQLAEAGAKTLFGVGFAYYGVRRSLPLAGCAALALIGIAFGSMLSALYLFLLSIVKGAWKREDGKSSYTVKSILKKLLSIALPVTMGSLVISLSNFIDLTLIMRLLPQTGMDSESANLIYGNYTGLAVPLFNLPPVIILPIAYAAVPKLTALRQAKQNDAIGKLSEAALKAASIFTIPAVLGLFVLSKEVLLILFERQSALRAAPLLTLLAPAVFFVGIVTVTNSLLQAAGKQFLPVFSMLCGGAVKFLVGILLIPKIGIAGAPIGTLACYLVIAVCNLIFTVKYCRLRLRFFSVFWSPLAASLGGVLTGKLLYIAFSAHLGVRWAGMVGILATALVYGVLLICFGTLCEKELAMLPIPQKCKKILLRLQRTKREVC